MGGKVAVDVINHLLVFLLGLRHGKEHTVVAIVHMMLECPVVEGVEVGRDNDSDALLVFAHNHGLVYVFRFAELVFKQLRGDVFSGREFEDIFLSVSDAEVALASQASHHLTHIAGMEPAIGVDDLGGVFGVFVVAQHDMGSACEDFAVVGKLHLHTLQNGTHGTYLHIAVDRIVDSDDWRCLRKTVALIDIDTRGSEGADDAWLDTGGTGNDNKAVAAEALAPVAIDGAVEEELRDLVAKGHLLEEGVVVAGAVFEGAGIDFLAETGEVLPCGIKFIIYHLQHTRHSAEPMGMDFGHVLLYGSHILRIVDAGTLKLEVVVHAPLIHVVEREETEHPTLGGHGVDLLVGDKVGTDVAMRKHDTLGLAGGARSVDKRHPVVGLYGVFKVRHDRAVLLAAGDTGLEHFERTVLTLDVGKGIDYGRILHFVESRTDAAQEYVVTHKHVFGFAVGEDMQVVVGAERGIDRHMDEARKGKGHVHKVPLRAVAGDGDDFVAGLEPHFYEAVGQIVGILIIIVCTIFNPLAFFLASKNIGLVGITGDKMVEQVEDTCYFHVCFISFFIVLQCPEPLSAMARTLLLLNSLVLAELQGDSPDENAKVQFFLNIWFFFVLLQFGIKDYLRPCRRYNGLKQGILMNIIIAGDGEVGFYLAKSLTELNHNITVVDPNSELLKRLEKETDLLTIAGSSTSPQVLSEANVGDCDLFLAVLHDESINLMSCILAKRLKAKRTVARISNAELLTPKHRDMFREIGVDELVCPERIAAKEITNLLNNSVATEFFDFSGGLLTMYLIRLEADSPVTGHSVQELVHTYNTLHVRIVAILRNGETIIPHAGLVFQQGDLAYLISRPNQLETIKQVSGKHDVQINKAMIVGAGRIGRYAAMTLEDKIRITLFEESRSRCEEAATLLDKTLVINGDATDIELLKEEGLQDTDAFIAVTDSSETNILTCLHAKKLGVNRTIALVENTGFISLSQDIGIDTIINKKLITASYISRFIVKGEAVSSKWLSGTNAELVEFNVGKWSPATRHTIRDLALPKGATIGGIIRGNETILPTRDTQIKAKDKVVVFALPKAMEQVAKLFE